MAWVRAGWKGPPKGEWRRRWQGRTWPEVKKLETNLGERRGVSGWLRWGLERRGGVYLFAKQMSAAPRVQRRLEGSMM